MSKAAPDTRDDYAHFLPITTRWMDNDAYQHVNNVTYYSYFDTVVNEFLIRSGELDIAASPHVNLVVETHCQFFRPLAFPDLVHAGLRIGHIGRTSVRYEVGIFRNDEATACAQGHFVHVHCDRATSAPQPIPASMRGALERLRHPAAP